MRTLSTTEMMTRKSFQFTISAKKIKVEEVDGYRIVKIPVQSVNQDRDGDVISEKGQQSIINQFKSGEIPAFPNHGWGDEIAMYDYRSILGQYIDAEVGEDGKTYATLRLRNGSEYADQLVDLLDQGMPVGFSIGFIPTEIDENSDEAKGMLIHDMDLLECSPVGIPSNASAIAGLSSGDKVAIAAKGAYTRGSDAETFVKALTSVLTNNHESNSQMTSKETEGTPEPKDVQANKEENEEEPEMDESKQTPEENATRIEELEATIQGLADKHLALEERVALIESDDSQESEEDSEDEKEENNADEEDSKSKEELSSEEKTSPRTPKKIKTAEKDDEDSEVDDKTSKAPVSAFTSHY